MDLSKLSAYEVLETYELGDIFSTGYRLVHKKTGAKVALIVNDDSNKVFSIGFRTPPEDSTGVAHILEHSVLCGSKEFPIKDPFVELAKGSLNTFLNAMTFPDKTVYPVASTNDSDFRNLMHVYLDAVFYPNVYKNESIFRQEGWHYEYDENGKLGINGVVYNEMKGARSSAEDIISSESMFSLFPDNAYGVESGGDPDCIPSLTYDAFLDFHRRYYHPSNSYIYLYGDVDMVDTLDFIDRKYLSKFDRLEIDSSIRRQDTFSAPVKVMKQCPLSSGENADENTFFSVNFAFDIDPDIRERIAFDIIDYALMAFPGAPLRKVLIEQGVVGDAYSRYETSVLQPFYSVIGTDAPMGMETRFGMLVTETIENIARTGLDKTALRAAIDSSEFRYREADFGRYPKGLMYGLNMFDSWLYDETKPFEYVQLNDVYAFLRENIDTGYFEKVLKKYLVGNKHRSYVTVRPTEGFMEKKESELRKKLDHIQNSLSDNDKKKIDDIFAALEKFRDTEDSEEALKCLPLLKREDLKREAVPINNEISDLGGSVFVYHDEETRGIGYLRLAFKCDAVGSDLISYIALLRDILTLVDTETHRYEELGPLINLSMGGFGISTEFYNKVGEFDNFILTFESKAKFFENKLDDAFSLIDEILMTSRFADLKRLKEVLNEIKNNLQSAFQGAGHVIAGMRACASLSYASATKDLMDGLEYYRFICGILDEFDAKAGDVTESLQYVLGLILRPENLIVDFTGSRDTADRIREKALDFKGRLYTERHRPPRRALRLVNKNEGFITSGQVLYVCRAGRYDRHGLKYSGALKVLKNYLSYNYLWVNVRVKGGAYGVMNTFGMSGLAFFVSYRDPNLTKTVEVYEGAAEDVANFDADEREMTKLIIGTVSEMDIPMSPQAKGSRSFAVYMCDDTYENIQRIRDEVLDCTPEDIRKCSEYIKEFMSDNKLFVVGNEKIITDNAKLFGKIDNLL